jgi:hypothetical protein
MNLSYFIKLYYGSVLLAFETSKELFLKGDNTNILNSISKDGGSMIFALNNDGSEYRLLPFY